MGIAILDDNFDTLRTLPCFTKLAAIEVEVWNDHVQDVDYSRRAWGTEVAGADSERTQIPAPLLERLRSSDSSASEASTRTSTSRPARGWV